MDRAQAVGELNRSGVSGRQREPGVVVADGGQLDPVAWPVPAWLPAAHCGAISAATSLTARTAALRAQMYLMRHPPSLTRSADQ